MVTFTHVIQDPLGLHARPAGMLAKTAAGFRSAITITAPSGTADVKRIMAVMRLSAKQGQELTFAITGDDEETAADTLKTFLKDNL